MLTFITFAAILSGQTMTLTGGQLLLDKNLTIDASGLPGGITISGGGVSRAFEVAAGTTVTLDSLTITNGRVIGDGGGIFNSGTLTVNRCTLAGNSATISGGAIYTLAGLTVNQSTLMGNSADEYGFNMNTTKESGEPDHAGIAGGKSVWWTWTAPANGTVTIDTIGSSFDTLLAVYQGDSVSTLTHIVSNDDIGGGVLQSRGTFAASAGTTYQIAVDGFEGQSGSIVLNLVEDTGAVGVSALAYTFITIAGKPSTGSSDGPGDVAQFNVPYGITSDSSGNLYVADAVNLTIRKVSPEGVVSTIASLTGWRFLGESGTNFFATGVTTTLLPGTYLIEFAAVGGRVKPPSQAVQVNDGQPSYLASGSWLPLSTNTISSSGFNLVLPRLANPATKFYRLRWLP